MIKYGFTKKGTCYSCSFKGEVIQDTLRNGNKVFRCAACYKSVTPPAGQPKQKSHRENWGNTAIEKEFAECAISAHDKVLHDQGQRPPCPKIDLGGNTMNVSNLDKVTNTILKEVIDEEDNIKQVVITLLSAWTTNPQNTRILAPSGEGKTWLVNHVSDLFPQENIIKLAHATAKSFSYYTTKKIVENGPGNWQDYETAMEPIESELKSVKDPNKLKELKDAQRFIYENTYNLVDFTNKIFIFLDSQSIQLWESIKTNLSHDGKYIKALGVNKSRSGRQQTEKTIFMGFPAVIYCSAKDEVEQDKTDEINTRFNTLSMRGNSNKYRQTLKLTGLRNGLPSLMYDQEIVSEEEKEECREIILQLVKSIEKYQEVLNPFLEWLSEQFPTNDGGHVNRRLDSFISLMNIITQINSESRPKAVIDQVEYPVTSKLDVIEANRLTKTIPDIATKKLQFFNENIKPAIQNIGNKKNLVDGSVTVATARHIAEEITDRTGNFTDKKCLQETYLRPLSEHGYVDSCEDPDSKRQYLYSIPEKYQTNDAILESTIIDNSTIDGSCVMSFKEKYLDHRFSSGDMTFFDSNGSRINLEKLVEIITAIDDKPTKIVPQKQLSGLSNAVEETEDNHV